MPEYASRLRLLVDRNVPRLLSLDEATTSARPAPGKWSPREILGHLIDSASNNHQRFVRAQATPEDVRLRLRVTHNLDRIAWRTIPAEQPATLDYFMEDYVGHLEHHLRQILGDSVKEGVDGS